MLILPPRPRTPDDPPDADGLTVEQRRAALDEIRSHCARSTFARLTRSLAAHGYPLDVLTVYR